MAGAPRAGYSDSPRGGLRTPAGGGLVWFGGGRVQKIRNILAFPEHRGSPGLPRSLLPPARRGALQEMSSRQHRRTRLGGPLIRTRRRPGPGAGAGLRSGPARLQPVFWGGRHSACVKTALVRLFGVHHTARVYLKALLAPQRGHTRTHTRVRSRKFHDAVLTLPPSGLAQSPHCGRLGRPLSREAARAPWRPGLLPMGATPPQLWHRERPHPRPVNARVPLGKNSPG